MRVPIVVLVLLVVGLLLFGVGVVAAIGILITVLEAVAILAAVRIFLIGAALVIDRFRPVAGACGLVSRAVLRDTCEGACPPGQTCAAATTRPYGPRSCLSRPRPRALRLPVEREKAGKEEPLSSRIAMMAKKPAVTEAYL